MIFLAAWTKWAEFGACDQTCGSGAKRRSRTCMVDQATHSHFADIYLNSEDRVCNTVACPSTPKTCSCETPGAVNCKSDQCGKKELCNLVTWFNEDPSQDQYQCQHKDCNRCFAWGDPHIVTFDNAKNDVYGIAQYTMAESDGTADIPAFKLKINTYDEPKWPHPATDKSYFQFPLRSGEKVEVEMTKEGESMIFINDQWVPLIPQENDDFTITKVGNKVTVTTWFGLVVSQDVNTIDIRTPGFYDSKTFGLCANNNKDKLDDYTTKEGVVLEYPPQHPNYSRFPSEEIAATSWITGSAERRGCLPYELEPELITEQLKLFNPGPPPETIFVCNDEVQKQCDDLFSSNWLQGCTNIVETTQMLEACKVEMCETTTVEQQEEIKAVILTQFISECKLSLPEEDPIVCNWPTLSGLGTDCGENMEYVPCGKRCEIKECDMVQTCTGNEETEALCMCKTGFEMTNGECVEPASCPTEGAWANWFEWNTCSLSCGTDGTHFRTRLCLGPAQCAGDANELDSCNVHECRT